MSDSADLQPIGDATTTRRVWRLGSDIDTDLLAPGHAMKHGIETIAKHCLEAVRPGFAKEVQAGDVIVAGPNFGIGSSREQAVAVLVHLGVIAVIAPSYGGLYFRNAFNLGLLLLTCPRAEEIGEDDRIRLSPDADGVFSLITESGDTLPCEVVPSFLMDMVRAGGLLNQLRRRAGKENSR